MVLFYAANGQPDPAAYSGWFMPLFLSAYRQENRLDPAWLAELPHFMKLREIDCLPPFISASKMATILMIPGVRAT
jgi:Ser/Thr protein kinase RdoA (MazF antagonist)